MQLVAAESWILSICHRLPLRLLWWCCWSGATTTTTMMEESFRVAVVVGGRQYLRRRRRHDSVRSVGAGWCHCTVPRNYFVVDDVGVPQNRNCPRSARPKCQKMFQNIEVVASMAVLVHQYRSLCRCDAMRRDASSCSTAFCCCHWPSTSVFFSLGGHTHSLLSLVQILPELYAAIGSKS